MNDQIQVKKLKVIDENGEQLGVMDTEKAQDIADSKGLDLVLVSPDTVNPVARIMDYGKMAFERAKKQKLKEIENKIFEIEEKIEICNKDIQNPEIFNDKDKFLQIGEDLSRLIKEKEKLYLEWENYL